MFTGSDSPKPTRPIFSLEEGCRFDTEGLDTSKADDDANEFSFIFVAKPNKLKIDFRLLSGFCMEAAVPLEEGRNVQTIGLIVGRRLSKEIQMTHIVIPKDNSSCMKEARWVDTIFKPWGNNTEIVGVIVSHIGNDDVFGLSNNDVNTVSRLMNSPLSVTIVAGFV